MNLSDLIKELPAAVSMTELGYLDGVTSNIQTQLGGKQDTLVSGTNIKTVNNTSLLGSGDITISGGGGLGGAVETTSAVDITLTAASERVQIINMTATGKIVTLPDATTLDEGGIVYIFRATGYNYLVLRSDGRFVATVESGKVAQVSLVNNSTAAGTWTGQMITDTNPGVGIGIPSVFESANTQYPSSVWLDSTRCFVAYRDAGNSNYLTGCVLTVSGATFVPGTPFVILSEAWSYTTCCKIGSDKVMITGSRTSGTTYGAAVALTISGSTSGAVGTPVELASTTANDAVYPVCCRMADDKVFVVYNPVGTTSYPTAKVLTVSGLTITTNAAATILATALTGTKSITCTLLDTDKVLVAYSVGYTTRAVVCTISTATITVQTLVSFDGTRAGSYIMLTALSATKAVVIYANTAGTYSLYHCVLNISGNTVIYGIPIEFDGATTQYPTALVATSANSAFAAWNYNNDATTIAQFTVSGNSITISKLTNTLSGALPYSNAMSRSATGDIAYTYPAPSTNYGTSLLLVG